MRSSLLLLPIIFAAACQGPQPVTNSNAAAANTDRGQRPETVIAHSIEDRAALRPNSPPQTEGKTKWTQSGDPIDTRELDAAVSTAEKTIKARPDDGAAKDALAAAYLKRAIALTEARQYASALGDYRRTLKYDLDNAEAHDWIKQIVMIYKSLGREAPREGEEPPPLPFKG